MTSFPTARYKIYYSIARQLHERAMEVKQRAKALEDLHAAEIGTGERPKTFFSDDRKEIRTLESQWGRLADAAVVYSAMTLESFINFYAYEGFDGLVGGLDVYAHLDHINIAEKWVLFPRLGVGSLPDDEATRKKLVDADKEYRCALKNANLLFSTRNDIVHDKPVAYFPETDEEQPTRKPKWVIEAQDPGAATQEDQDRAKRQSEKDRAESARKKNEVRDNPIKIVQEILHALHDLDESADIEWLSGPIRKEDSFWEFAV